MNTFCGVSRLRQLWLIAGMMAATSPVAARNQDEPMLRLQSTVCEAFSLYLTPDDDPMSAKRDASGQLGLVTPLSDAWIKAEVHATCGGEQQRKLVWGMVYPDTPCSVETLPDVPPPWWYAPLAMISALYIAAVAVTFVDAKLAGDAKRRAWVALVPGIGPVLYLRRYYPYQPTHLPDQWDR
jgi:hypothetical protein